MSAKSIEFDINFRKGRRGRQYIALGQASNESNEPEGFVPRISKLMALAIKMDGMIQRGEVKNYAELAILGHVSRARITQIMDLLLLAPDIQEEILFLDPNKAKTTFYKLKNIYLISKIVLWNQQRKNMRILTMIDK